MCKTTPLRQLTLQYTITLNLWRSKTCDIKDKTHDIKGQKDYTNEVKDKRTNRRWME